MEYICGRHSQFVGHRQSGEQQLNPPRAARVVPVFSTILGLAGRRNGGPGYSLRA